VLIWEWIKGTTLVRKEKGGDSVERVDGSSRRNKTHRKTHRRDTPGEEVRQACFGAAAERNTMLQPRTCGRRRSTGGSSSKRSKLLWLAGEHTRSSSSSSAGGGGGGDGAMKERQHQEVRRRSVSCWKHYCTGQ